MAGGLVNAASNSAVVYLRIASLVLYDSSQRPAFKLRPTKIVCGESLALLVGQ